MKNFIEKKVKKGVLLCLCVSLLISHQSCIFMMLGGASQERQLVKPKKEKIDAAMAKGRRLGEGYKYGPWEWQYYTDGSKVQGPAYARKKFSANLEKMGYQYIDDQQYKYFLPKSEVNGFEYERQYVRGGLDEEYRQNKNLRGADFKSVGAAWIMDRISPVMKNGVWLLERADRFFYCNDIKWTGNIKNGLLDGAGDGYVVVKTDQGDECYAISGVFEEGKIVNAIISNEKYKSGRDAYSPISVSTRPFQNGIRIYSISETAKDGKRKIAPYDGIVDDKFQMLSPRFERIRGNTREGKLIATYNGIEVIINKKGEILEIEKGITTIPQKAFFRCKLLTNIAIPDGVTSIEDDAFYQSSITNVKLPSSLKKIGKRAFYLCGNLKALQLPSQLENIEEEAFGGCEALTSVIIPNSVKEIGNNVFLLCTGLTSASVPAALYVKGYSIFRSCSNLKSIAVRQLNGKEKLDSEWYWFESESPADRKAREEGEKANQDLANSSSWKNPDYETSWSGSTYNGVTTYERYVKWDEFGGYNGKLFHVYWRTYSALPDDYHVPGVGVYTNYVDAIAALYLWEKHKVLRTRGLKRRD